MGMNILKEAIPQVESQIKQQLKLQLQAQLGEEFLKTEEGQDILQQLADLISL